MRHLMPEGLLDAVRMTKAGRLADATASLQRILQGNAEVPPRVAPQPRVKPAPFAGGLGVRRPRAAPPGRGGFPPPVADAPAPVGARFVSLNFSGQTGSRPYKLYVPSGYHGQPVPLVVMLHGCTQSPDDFAAGTRMNATAEEHTILVAYPGQTEAANSMKCWNWFQPGDQRRDRGEPGLIAGITREIMGAYAVDPRRVYVAGLSAGGAAAAIMGDAYPDLFAAVGVHSGLACGAASDMLTAFSAMQQGRDVRGSPPAAGNTPGRPAIVFHGDRDTTVHPANGDAVVAQASQEATLRTRAHEGRVPGGHAYTQTVHADADGRTLIEQWAVHGAGHAWSGGSPDGSYTDPRGPDATREMLRFFLEHPRLA
jgi:poly(hydroxyalkanoate) depolymerase family esterase